MKVFTTIDLNKQAEARDTISDHLAGIGPSSAIVTLNPRNGYIEAMASSGDYGESNFNLAAQGHRRPGSTFKVMALMAALRRGVDPDSTHYTSVSPTIIDDPIYGHIDIKTYGGKGAGNMSLRRATLALRQLGLHPARARPRARPGQADRARHGHHLDAQGLPGRDARRPGERRLAARDGDRVRQHRLGRLPPAPDGDQEDQVPGRPRRGGRRAARALPRQEGPHLPRRRRGRGDRDPRAEHPGRHRHARHDRLPRGRQDRHDRLQHRRLVRRLHAAPRDRRLGRLPEGRHPDERPLLRPQRRRRHVPRRHLGRLHGPHQGQLLRRLRAAEAAVRLLAVLRQVLQVGRLARPARASRASTRARTPSDGRPTTTPAAPWPRTTRPTTRTPDDAARASIPAPTSRRRSPSRTPSRRRPADGDGGATAPPAHG